MTNHPPIALPVIHRRVRHAASQGVCKVVRHTLSPNVICSTCSVP